MILTTDASDFAIGYIVSQLDDEKRERPIAYGGRKLTDLETRRSTVEKELLAIVYAIKENQSYFSLNTTTVYTDNRALTYLTQFKAKNGRLLRWALLLDSFDLNIIHKPGRLNQADTLSRRSYPDSTMPKNDFTNETVALAIIQPPAKPPHYNTRQLTAINLGHTNSCTPDQDNYSHELTADVNIAIVAATDTPALQRAQMSSADFGMIYDDLANGSLPDDQKQASKIVIESQQYQIDSNDILYHFYTPRTKKVPKQERIIAQVAVPEHYRADCIRKYHDELAHFSLPKVYGTMRLKYFWPKMYAQLENYIKSCDVC